MLRGDKLLPVGEAVEIVRALPHGHVLAALGTARRVALDSSRVIALAAMLAGLPVRTSRR